MIRIVASSNTKVVGALLAAARIRDRATDTATAAIVERVRKGGDRALGAYARQFDNLTGSIEVPREEWESAARTVPAAVRRAIREAAASIRRVAKAQVPKGFRVTVRPGVTVEQRVVPKEAQRSEQRVQEGKLVIEDRHPQVAGAPIGECVDPGQHDRRHLHHRQHFEVTECCAIDRASGGFFVERHQLVGRREARGARRAAAPEVRDAPRHVFDGIAEVHHFPVENSSEACLCAGPLDQPVAEPVVAVQQHDFARRRRMSP